MQSAFLILACWSWAFWGCGGTDLPEVNFIGSDPPTGSLVPTVLAHVELFFDGLPQSVTVNGVPAHVDYTTATWEIPAELGIDDRQLEVAWLNQDGSEGKGVIIYYDIATVTFIRPTIVESTVYNGDNDVNPERINRLGMTIVFATAVRPGTIELRPEGGKPLNWSAEWRCGSVTITPQGDGERLLHGKDYVIEITGIKSDLPNIRDEAIEVFNFTLQFSTKE